LCVEEGDRSKGRQTDNLDQGRVSDDNVSIDVRPMLLAIENARSGLIWKLFMSHQMAKQGVDRLGWKPIFEPKFSDSMELEDPRPGQGALE
jgi:hypothetical protein